MKPGKCMVWPSRLLLMVLLGLLSVLSVVVAGVGLHARAAAAATLTVTDCSGETGPGRIGTVISSASAGDTITFSCSGTIPITTTLTISKNLTLDGSGQMVTLDGNNSVQVLSVTSAVSFTLNALTIAHGLVTPTGIGFVSGGGLENLGGTVSISNSTFANNSAFNDGGGLGNRFGGTVSISNSTFANNSADRNGGGLENLGGTMSISNSTFANNSVRVGNGGGLINFGTMSISSSTFANNSADTGGGIWNGGTMSISNSTFANNSGAFAGGGGIINNQSSTVSISNSTFANNSAPNGFGGGLRNFFGTVSIGGSIVANNTGGNCSGGTSSSGGISSDQGYNLESATDCGFTGTGDLQNSDPKLASSLASNGGPTQTLALRDGSPAINHIPNSACTVTTDQRGISRPQGPACDIGAFEFRVPKLNLPNTITVDATSPQGSSVTYPVTASEPDDASATPTVSCTPASGSTFPIGTTTVNCTASDAASPPDTTSGSFQVVVKGPAAQVVDLINLVNSFNLSPQGIQTSFDSQLQAVQADLTANNTAQACSDLTSFINHVNAQSGKILTTGQATQLIAAAQRIQAVLAC